jgi:hypothetical protein
MEVRAGRVEWAVESDQGPVLVAGTSKVDEFHIRPFLRRCAPLGSSESFSPCVIKLNKHMIISRPIISFAKKGRNIMQGELP